MSDKNHAWSWPSISAGIFIGAVGAFIGGLLVAIVMNMFFVKSDSVSTSTSTVTVGPPPATVTVTATSGEDSPKQPADTSSPGAPQPEGTGGSMPDDVLLLASLKLADGNRFGNDESYKIGTVLYPHS